MARLNPGDPFPEFTLDSTEGPVAVGERWRGGPLVVVYVRHFGCPFCQEHLAELGEVYPDIQAAGGDVVAIFQYRAEPTRNYCRRRDVPFDCLGDPKRESYKAVALGRYPISKFAVSPKVIGRTARAASHGHIAHYRGGDMRQAPGTFVVGPDGRIVLAHYNEDSTDNPSNDAVLSAVREAATATPA